MENTQFESRGVTLNRLREERQALNKSRCAGTWRRTPPRSTAFSPAYRAAPSLFPVIP